MKSQSELAAARAEGIEKGEVIPADTPIVEAERRSPPPPPPPDPIRPSKDSIRGDILIVNNSTLTVAEVLYPLREWIETIRASQTPRGFMQQLVRGIRDQVRQDIGSLLVYQKALAQLGEPQLAAVDEAVDREVDKQVAHNFGGSAARFESHLRKYGLTMEKFRELVKRQLVVGSYTRELLAPQISAPRYELFGYYRDNIKRYSTEETRELLLIELPAAKFLPPGVRWEQASESLRAQARLQALRQAQAAYEALKESDFGEVAREYSSGLHAENGGSWGQIGQPLQPPYDKASRRIFDLEEGQFTEPIQTETGCYIAGCGKIEPAQTRAFVDVQEEIRAELESHRLQKLSGDYVWRLAENATISDLGTFVSVAVERAKTLPERRD